MSAELRLSDEETETALNLLEQRLPPLTRRTWIPFLFGVSPKLIGAMEIHSFRYYRRFTIPKRSGGRREIVTPKRFLKTIQRWLLHRVFSHLPTSSAAHGFVAGRNIFSNAAVHLGGKNLLAADIESFFPSVTIERIKEVMSADLPFPDPVTDQLAGLCTLGGALPQGAPTSPALANAAFDSADAGLSQLAAAWGVSYSRYADDIAFSGDRAFTAADLAEVQGVVEEAGFNLNVGKSRIVGSGARQVVAGLVVNNRGLPPREVRRRWRAMFHRAAEHPLEFRDRAKSLGGIASFVNQYDGPLAEVYWEVVRRIEAQAREE